MREELVRQIQGELARLNRLITDVSNVSRLDAELAYGETDLIDIREVLNGVFNIFQDRFSTDTRKLVLAIQDITSPAGYTVRAHEARLDGLGMEPVERRLHGRIARHLDLEALALGPEAPRRLEIRVSHQPVHAPPELRDRPLAGRERRQARRAVQALLRARERRVDAGLVEPERVSCE